MKLICMLMYDDSGIKSIGVKDAYLRPRILYKFPLKTKLTPYAPKIIIVAFEGWPLVCA